MDEPNVSADDFERAFCEAVQRYAAEEWTPAIPDQRMILVASKPQTIRHVCLPVLNNNNELPDVIVRRLFESMRIQHDRLRERLGRTASYAIGAECLIDLLDERERTYKERQASRGG
jgi:hypothetical protein